MCSAETTLASPNPSLVKVKKCFKNCSKKTLDMLKSLVKTGRRENKLRNKIESHRHGGPPFAVNDRVVHHVHSTAKQCSSARLRVGINVLAI